MKSILSSIKNGLSMAWKWVVLSSADPANISLTVKGFASLAIVQLIFNQVLPLLGFHPAFDLTTLADAVSTVVFYLATVISSLVATIGALRKLVLTVQGRNVSA